MNKKQAIKIAIQCMRREQREYASSASAYESTHESYYAEKAKKFHELDQAIIVLESIGRQEVMEI